VVVGIIMGRRGSRGFPGKNLYPVCGKPMVEWVVQSAVCSKIDRVYVTTDDSDIMRIGELYGCETIRRPKELCDSSALGDAVYQHAYQEIVDRVGPVNLVVMLCANAPTFSAGQINDGLGTLARDSNYDSACTVSKYNWYSPNRARRIENNVVVPYDERVVDVGSCDRDSTGDCYFYDCCVGIARPHGMEHMEEGQPPQKWLAGRIYPILNEGGLDIDSEFQLGQVEWWLRKYGMGNTGVRP